VLLADPEMLGNDALEGDLYILRDQLRAATSAEQTVPLAPRSESQNGNPEQWSGTSPAADFTEFVRNYPAVTRQWRLA
jgi:hypothetical protein